MNFWLHLPPLQNPFLSKYSSSVCLQPCFSTYESSSFIPAVENGSCQFGNMKMSWTSKAPCYDMDITILNEQRIRPLKLIKRPGLYDGLAVPRRGKGRQILPTLVKKRMGINGERFSRRSKRLSILDRNEGNFVTLPFLSSNVDKESSKSVSSVSINSNFEQLVDPTRARSHPPPPPNTAELIWIVINFCVIF